MSTKAAWGGPGVGGGPKKETSCRARKTCCHSTYTVQQDRRLREGGTRKHAGKFDAQLDISTAPTRQLQISKDSRLD